MQVLNWSEIILVREQMVDELCIKFKNISKEFKYRGQHSPIEYVEGRVKNITSIINKANKKNIPYSEIENRIEDIAGIRIVCKFVEDIDKVVKLIKDRDGKDLKIIEERDYITNNKPSGYRSYHLIIKYKIITLLGEKEIFGEIQIRTIAMNFWATVEHSLRYKYKSNIPSDIQERLNVTAKAAFNLDIEMSNIRDEILQAQKTVEEKNDVVNNILKNIEKLHFVSKLNYAKDLNREFFEIYEKDDIVNFHEFNKQLESVIKQNNLIM
jgi:putative GTP pyrophosphokinase